MANRLQHETSPYLRQHALNPVDWYPWGPEALGRSRAENRPIFLSIGYSACHWCHVMEHESFENAGIAKLLNEHFISIKVDREERPDLDHIYMTAVQILTGRGGWPMSVFLTPDLQPFFGGTYWPPHARHGMPGFEQVLSAVIDAWAQRETLAREQAQQLTERMAALGQSDDGDGELDGSLLVSAGHSLQRAFDGMYGGFGDAPKFPHAIDLQVLLRLWQRTGQSHWRDMAEKSLDGMASGGIYDHLGGGFARYSVDARWLVPHFEKMLYDNGLLASAYLEGYLVTRKPRYAQIVRETIDYVLRDLTHEAGAFYSSEDADSEGEEGRFYLWSRAEIIAELGESVGDRFCDVYDVSEVGNFEHRNILNLPRSVEQMAALRGWDLAELTAQLHSARAKLLKVRSERVRPGRDDKILVSWNGLMVDSMARAAVALQEPRYLEAACRAAQFLRDQLWVDQRLLHSWCAGTARFAAYLDDYGALGQALVTLYESTFDSRWLDWACELAEQMCERFRDPQGGAFYYTADDHERLIARTKDLQDSSVPSGNGLTAMLLARLGELTGRDDYTATAHAIVRSAGGLLEQAPTAAGQLLLAADFLLGPTAQVVIVGDANHAELQAAIVDLHQRFVPRRVIAQRSRDAKPSDLDPLAHLFMNRLEGNDADPTFYVCQQQTCWEPAVGLAAARHLWDRLGALR